LKPPPFDYHAPETVEEATQLLASGDGVRVLAGGQSLVQLMKFRLARPARLIDINQVSGLDSIEQCDGELRIGALVRQQALLEDELVAESWPLLRQAAGFVGYRETRRRGTLAGSLAFAAPWGELTAAAVALNAAIDVRSERGKRTIEARNFFRGPNQTSLEGDELIVRFGSRRRRLAAERRFTKSACATAIMRSSLPRRWSRPMAGQSLCCCASPALLTQSTPPRPSRSQARWRSCSTGARRRRPWQ